MGWSRVRQDAPQYGRGGRERSAFAVAALALCPLLLVLSRRCSQSRRVPSCDATRPLTHPSQLNGGTALFYPLYISVSLCGYGYLCSCGKAGWRGGSGSRWHVKCHPPLTVLMCRGWLPWEEAGADGGLGRLLDHTLCPCRPRLSAQAGLPPAAKLSLKTGTCLSFTQLPFLKPGPSPSLSFLYPHFFPQAVLRGCCGVRMPGVVSPVPAERASAPRTQPSHYTLEALLLVQAPAHLPALREVPHLESRRGGCRSERGT